MNTYTATLLVRPDNGAPPVLLPVPRQPDSPEYTKPDQAERKLERVARMFGTVRNVGLFGHVYKGGNLVRTIAL